MSISGPILFCLGLPTEGMDGWTGWVKMIGSLFFMYILLVWFGLPTRSMCLGRLEVSRVYTLPQHKSPFIYTPLAAKAPLHAGLSGYNSVCEATCYPECRPWQLFVVIIDSPLYPTPQHRICYSYKVSQFDSSIITCRKRPSSHTISTLSKSTHNLKFPPSQPPPSSPRPPSRPQPRPTTRWPHQHRQAPSPQQPATRPPPRAGRVSRRTRPRSAAASSAGAR